MGLDLAHRCTACLVINRERDRAKNICEIGPRGRIHDVSDALRWLSNSLIVCTSLCFACDSVMWPHVGYLGFRFRMCPRICSTVVVAHCLSTCIVACIQCACCVLSSRRTLYKGPVPSAATHTRNDFAASCTSVILLSVSVCVCVFMHVHVSFAWAVVVA